MNDIIINEILNALPIDSLSSEQLSLFKMKLYSFFSSYDIVKQKTELTQYEENQIPYEVMEYLTYLKVSGLSINTLKNYELELRLFYQTINTYICYVTSSTIVRYLYQCQSISKSADVTVEHKRIVINGFYNWMLLEHYIYENPCCRIKPIKCTKKKLEALTNLELEKIRLSCPSIREKCLVEVLYSTGMRVSELVNLNISQIDFTNNKAIIKGKGKKERIIRFSERSILLIDQYINNRTDANDALFVSTRKPFRRLSKAGIEYLIHQLASLAGINRISVTPHTFRRCHGLAIYRRTNDIYQAAESLGHTNISTTTQYVKLSQEGIQRTFDYCMN